MARETIYTSRLIIVVTAALRAAANLKAAELDTAGGALTFTNGLSATGSGSPTHYWCNWQLTPAEQTLLDGKIRPLGNATKVRIFDGMTTTPAQVLATMGLTEINQ
jgi:hypothetical protein